MHEGHAVPRLLILIVAYQAETTIASVLSRIAPDLPGVSPEILILDDGSHDATAQSALAAQAPYPVTVLRNPVNQGYGGNQKLGYHYAIAHGFDLVAMVHGDGQYAPERLPEGQASGRRRPAEHRGQATVAAEAEPADRSLWWPVAGRVEAGRCR